jgi:TRAP-type C4-dicarboxylate transport system permease small subunit
METLNQFNVNDFAEKLVPFKPMFDPSRFLINAVVLLSLGFFVVVYFISYQVTHRTNKSRSLVTELSLASIASVLLGTGAMMGMLASGLYV